MTNIDDWNKKAADFMSARKNVKGTYKALQSTVIWANGKKALLDMKAKNNKVVCGHCHKPIDITKETAVLHHKRYSWKEVFNPNYVSFMHHNCHQRTHHIKNNYRRKRKR